MGVIAGNKVVAFQAADAFGYRRGGETDFFSQFGHGDACILL